MISVIYILHITPPDYVCLQILGVVPFFLLIPHTRPLLGSPTMHKPFSFVIHVATKVACLVFDVSLGGFIRVAPQWNIACGYPWQTNDCHWSTWNWRKSISDQNDAIPLAGMTAYQNISLSLGIMITLVYCCNGVLSLFLFPPLSCSASATTLLLDQRKRVVFLPSTSDVVQSNE